MAGGLAMVDSHDRVLARAIALGVAQARIVHRGTRRPHLIGVVDGVDILVGLPLRPKDTSRNYFNCLTALRKTVASVRHRTKSAAA